MDADICDEDSQHRHLNRHSGIHPLNGDQDSKLK